MIVDTIRGAQASAIIYSVTETARANNLNVYYYISHLLAELPRLIGQKGNIEQSMLEPLMPWSSTLPAECYSSAASKWRYIYRGAENLTHTFYGIICYLIFWISKLIWR